MDISSGRSDVRNCWLDAILILHLLSATVTHAQGSRETLASIPESIVWRTGAVHEEAIPLEIERLYLTLYNTQNLQIKKYTGDANKKIEDILREERLFFGNYFPVGIDSLLCDLNKDVCKRERVPTNTDLAKTDSHVGGYKKSVGIWSNHAKSTLYLPVIEFVNFIDFKLTDKTAGKSADEILNELDVDCKETYGTACREMVQSLNAHNPDVLKK